MFNMAIIGEGVEGVINILPSEIASKLDLLVVLVQAIGGLAVIYLIFLLIRFYLVKKQTKMLEGMQKDIAFIKKKLMKSKK